MTQNTSSEEWRQVPSAPKYYASSFGRIRGPRGIRKLCSPPKARGYLRVSVMIGNVVRSFGAHVLVCEAFHGPKPSPEHEVAHWDGMRPNNNEANLRWATHAENGQDMVRHGVVAKDRHPRASLTSADVIEIRRRRALRPPQYAGRGWRPSVMAEFGITIHVLKDILADRSWRGI